MKNLEIIVYKRFVQSDNKIPQSTFLNRVKPIK